MECKHFCAIKSVACRSLESLRICRIRWTKRSRAKVTRLWRQRDERNARFIERRKTRCLLPLKRAPSTHLGSLLRKWNSRLCAAGERTCWEKRGAVDEWEKERKKKERRSLFLSSLIATRRVMADREQKFSYFSKIYFPPLLSFPTPWDCFSPISFDVNLGL